jgi:Family of unknown function (DUF6117)
MAKTKSKKIPEKFLNGFKPNFKTLRKACKNNNLALVECLDLKTKQKVAMVCAVHWDGKQFNLVPLATMNEGNPYERFSPPNPNGGFFSEEELKTSGDCNHSPCICKGKQ